MTEQKQRSGDNSVNIQAEIYNQGIAIEQVQEIVNNAVAAEIYRYSLNARQEMLANLRIIAEKIVHKVALSGAEATSKFANPDIQYNLGLVGLEYSRSGDEDLGDLLVELLNDRCQHENRTLMAVVLNDAIATAPRLTDAELAILSVAWLVSRVKIEGDITLKQLVDHLVQYALPFADKIAGGQSIYQHLEFAGCGSLDYTTQVRLGKCLTTFYPGLFSKGLSRVEIPVELHYLLDVEEVFKKNDRDNSKFQLSAVAENVLHRVIADLGLSEYREALIRLLRMNILADEEVEAEILKIDPSLIWLIETWNSNEIRRLRLTSVGTAIGHANLNRLIQIDAPLSIWVY